MRAESSLCGPGLVLTFSEASVPHLLNGESNHKDLHLQAAMRPGVQLADQTPPSTSARTQAAKGKSSGSRLLLLDSPALGLRGPWGSAAPQWPEAPGHLEPVSFWLIQLTSDPTQDRGRQELRPRRWKGLVGGVTQQVRAASRSEPGPPGSQHFQVQGRGLSSCVRLTKDGAAISLTQSASTRDPQVWWALPSEKDSPYLPRGHP